MEWIEDSAQSYQKVSDDLKVTNTDAMMNSFNDALRPFLQICLWHSQQEPTIRSDHFTSLRPRCLPLKSVAGHEGDICGYRFSKLVTDDSTLEISPPV